MTKATKSVIESALRLSKENRAHVARVLLGSLEEGAEDPREVEKAWAVEIERRTRRVIEGKSPGIPAEEVLAAPSRRRAK